MTSDESPEGVDESTDTLHGAWMARDVREVGNAVLAEAAIAGFRLTNIALNKIVYFAHAWSLAQLNRPLVDSPFAAF